MVEETASTAGPSADVGGRVAERVRWAAIRGLASVVTGLFVLGVGGRLVMLASRLIHPEAVGRVTENGNRVGLLTVDGTIELVVFGGVFGGVAAAVVWVIVWQWIPRHPIVVGFGAAAIGGFNVIDAGNRDFVILVDPLPDVALLVGLLFAFGVLLVGVDGWLEERFPKGTRSALIASTVVVVLGAPFVIPVMGSFFTTEFCLCENPPFLTGIFVTAALLASVWWWAASVRGSRVAPAALKRIGTTSVALAAIAGAIHLASEINAI